MYGRQNGGIWVIEKSTPVPPNLIPSCQPAQPQSFVDVGVLHGPDFNVKDFPLHDCRCRLSAFLFPFFPYPFSEAYDVTTG